MGEASTQGGVRRSSPWSCRPLGKSSAGKCPQPQRPSCSGGRLSNGPRHFGPWRSLQTPEGRETEIRHLNVEETTCIIKLKLCEFCRKTTTLTADVFK